MTRRRKRPNYRMEIVLTGGPKVGRRSLVWAFQKGKLPADPRDVTVTLELMERVIIDCRSYERGVATRFWESTGLGGHFRVYFRGWSACVVMFSIDSRESFDAVQYYVSEARANVPLVPVVLVGTKKDLRGITDETVSEEEGKQKAEEIGALCYMECSAKTGEGVFDVLTTAERFAAGFPLKIDYTRKRRKNGK